MTRATIPDRNCPEFSNAEATDFMKLGERPATAGMRRVLCYCHPQRCREAALRKLRRDFPENSTARPAELPEPATGDPAASEVK